MDTYKPHSTFYYYNILSKLLAFISVGVFFSLVIYQRTISNHLFNQTDYFLSFFMIIHITGLFLMYKDEKVAGYLMLLSGLHYEIIWYYSASAFYQGLHGIYLSVPGALLILGSLYSNKKKKGNKAYDKNNDNLTELAQNYRITEAMFDISLEMIHNDNLDFILQHVLEKTIENIPNAQTGSIMLKVKDRIEFHAAVGYDLGILKQINIQYKDLVQYKLGAIHEPVIIRNIKTYDSTDIGVDNLNERIQSGKIVAKSMLTHVIKHDHQVFGFINIENLENEKAFLVKDKSIMENVTKYIEKILNNQSLINGIYRMIRYDTLTGAYTRNYYETLLKKVYEESIIQSTSFSIVTYDLDDLKLKNDTYGHEAGDLYLIHFTSIIKDEIPKGSFLSRIGGDEFVLVIPKMSSEQVDHLMDEINFKIQNSKFIYENSMLPIKYSYGIASFPEDHQDLDDLIRLSDQRMYENKKRTKVFFDKKDE